MPKIIIMSELQSRTLSELHALYRKIHENLVRSEPDSVERRNALASLENISRAINTRRLVKPYPV